MHRLYYFPSRQAAGDLIADVLESKYRYEDCAVLALGDGSVVVGAEIAKRLHCVLNMLLCSSILLPRDEMPVATINNFGGVTYNDEYSPGELEELRAEYFSFFEQQKIEKIFEMNRLLGAGGALDPKLLKNRNIIIVSDGLSNGMSMHAAAEFLKPIKVKRMIMVAPFASVSAVDQMHVMANEIVCLNVLEDIISIDHYYDDNKIPSHETVVRILEDIVLHWR